MFINIFDSHVHSDNSFDGHNSITQLCEAAIKKELSGMAITDHCDINYYDEQHCERRMKQSFFEGLIAKDIFKKQLSVSLGMELGQPFENIEKSEHAVKMQDYDFILVALHNNIGEQDFYYLDYHKTDIDKLLTNYFKQLLEIIKWGQFDVLAHMTYPLRHIAGEYRIDVDMSKYKYLTDEILKLLVEKGQGLELNLSGLRKKSQLLMPTMDYFKTFKEMGGEIVTIGSDSHFANDIGDFIGDGMEFLSNMGYRYFAFYKNRKPTMLRII